MAVVAVLAVAFAAAAVAQRAPAADIYRYEDLPGRFGFPVAEATLLGAVLADDQPAVRRHAWELWAALTAPSASVVDGQRLPVFATWYSIPEVYNSKGRAGVTRRTFGHPFRIPTQSALANSSRGGAPAGLMSFVKLNRQAAGFIWDNGYYLTPTLAGLNARFDRDGTATVERSIKPFPNDAVSLKLVFWLVKNPASPQAERGLTALPIWGPNYPPPPDGSPPMHTTWTNAVAVDPAGRYPEGSLQQVNVNGSVARPNLKWAPVVSLKRFYAHRLTKAQDVADARVYMDMMSSAAGEQERFVTNAGQTPELGDYIVLLGLHMTTKEMDDWTFQTFLVDALAARGAVRRRSARHRPPAVRQLPDVHRVQHRVATGRRRRAADLLQSVSRDRSRPDQAVPDGRHDVSRRSDGRHARELPELSSPRGVPRVRPQGARRRGHGPCLQRRLPVARCSLLRAAAEGRLHVVACAQERGAMRCYAWDLLRGRGCSL